MVLAGYGTPVMLAVAARRPEQFSTKLPLLVTGRVQRQCQAAEFGTLEADLQAALHGEKLGQLRELL